MEVGTFTAAEASTGSRTMADLALAAGAKFADGPALRHKVGDEWVDITYAELADKVRTVAAGLIELGIQPGDKVAILSNTPPRVDLRLLRHPGRRRAPASRSTRPTRRRSATTCSTTRRRARCSSRTRSSSRRSAPSAASCRRSSTSSSRWTPAAATARSALDELRERGRGRDGRELDERIAGGRARRHLPSTSTRRARPGRRRAACSTTPTTARSSTWSRQHDARRGRPVYLFLPLAHAFALLIQFAAIDLGATIAYWEKDPQKIIPNLMEVKPTLLPVGAADLREDLHAGDSAARDPRASSSRRSRSASRCARCRSAARRCRPSSRRRSTQADEAAVPERAQPVRRAHPPVRHGRRADRAGDPRVLLRLRRAGDGGLRHDRDLHRRDGQPLGARSASARSASRCRASR